MTINFNINANGEIKTKHWLEIGTVAVGSPAWNAGMRTGYNIEGTMVLDDVSTASKRLVKGKSTIKVYLRKKKKRWKSIEKTENNMAHVSVTLIKLSKESFGLKFAERNGITYFESI